MSGTLQNGHHTTSMTHTSNGARLVSAGGETLPLRDISLASEVVAGIARTILRQHFTNQYSIPLELLYQFPLPADGAISAYEIVAGERRIVGRVERRDDARAEYEAARLTGRTASLVEQERPNLFTQHLGNIPASTDVTVQLTVDHPLTWLPGIGWEWRFPTVVAPRYLGAEAVVADSKAVTVDVTTDPVSLQASVALTILDDVQEAPISPTHPVAVNGKTVTVDGNAALDRDVVIRWSVPSLTPGCTVRVGRPSPQCYGRFHGVWTPHHRAADGACGSPAEGSDPAAGCQRLDERSTARTSEIRGHQADRQPWRRRHPGDGRVLLGTGAIQPGARPHH